MTEPYNTPPGTTQAQIEPPELECDHKYLSGASALEPLRGGGFICDLCEKVVGDER